MFNRWQRIGFCMSALLFEALAAAQGTTIGATTLSAIVREKKVLSILRWDVSDGELWCVFSERPPNRSLGEALPLRTLTVYRQAGSGLAPIFEHSTGYAFASTYLMGDFDANLFTAWVGGSAYHVIVFSYLRGKVQVTLERASKDLPDFVTDETGRQSILFNEIDLEGDKWVQKTTDIYRWSGKGFDKIGTVPSRARFEFLFQGRRSSR